MFKSWHFLLYLYNMRKLIPLFVLTIALLSACGGDKETRKECAIRSAKLFQESVEDAENGPDALTGVNLDAFIVLAGGAWKQMLIEQCGYSSYEADVLTGG